MELVEYLKFSTGSEKADIDNYKLGECYDLIQEFIEYDRAEQLKLCEVSNRFKFKDIKPPLGSYISLVWEDGSDCECIYNGLDKSIKPLPKEWYYVN